LRDEESQLQDTDWIVGGEGESGARSQKPGGGEGGMMRERDDEMMGGQDDEKSISPSPTHPLTLPPSSSASPTHPLTLPPSPSSPPSPSLHLPTPPIEAQRIVKTADGRVYLVADEVGDGLADPWLPQVDCGGQALETGVFQQDPMFGN
jgi:hypothetical protein